MVRGTLTHTAFLWELDRFLYNADDIAGKTLHLDSGKKKGFAMRCSGIPKVIPLQ